MSYMFKDIQEVQGVAGSLPTLHVKGIGWPDGAENRKSDQEKLKDQDLLWYLEFILESRGPPLQGPHCHWVTRLLLIHCGHT